MSKPNNTIMIHIAGGAVQTVLSTDPFTTCIVVDEDVEGTDNYQECPVEIPGALLRKGEEVIITERHVYDLDAATADELRNAVE